MALLPFRLNTATSGWLTQFFFFFLIQAPETLILLSNIIYTRQVTPATRLRSSAKRATWIGCFCCRIVAKKDSPPHLTIIKAELSGDRGRACEGCNLGKFPGHITAFTTNDLLSCDYSALNNLYLWSVITITFDPAFP